MHLLEFMPKKNNGNSKIMYNLTLSLFTKLSPLVFKL